MTRHKSEYYCPSCRELTLLCRTVDDTPIRLDYSHVQDGAYVISDGRTATHYDPDVAAHRTLHRFRRHVCLAKEES